MGLAVGCVEIWYGKGGAHGSREGRGGILRCGSSCFRLDVSSWSTKYSGPGGIQPHSSVEYDWKERLIPKKLPMSHQSFCPGFRERGSEGFN